MKSVEVKIAVNGFVLVETANRIELADTYVFTDAKKLGEHLEKMRKEKNNDSK